MPILNLIFSFSPGWCPAVETKIYASIHIKTSVSQVYLPQSTTTSDSHRGSKRQDTSSPDYFAINSTSLSKWVTFWMLSWTHFRTVITAGWPVSPCGWASYTWYGLWFMSIWELEGCVRQICYHSNFNLLRAASSCGFSLIMAVNSWKRRIDNLGPRKKIILRKVYGLGICDGIDVAFIIRQNGR